MSLILTNTLMASAQPVNAPISYANRMSKALVEALAEVDAYLYDGFTVLEVVAGRQGGFISFSPAGKVVVLPGVRKAGWAAITITEAKDTCYLGYAESTVWVKTPSCHGDGCPTELQGFDSFESLRDSAVDAAKTHRDRRSQEALKYALEVAVQKAKDDAKLDKADEWAGPDGVSFARMLSNLDWYFSYSDDHRVWRAGQPAMDAARTTRKAMGECGDLIWALYAPSGF